MILEAFPKAVSEVLDYRIDFSRWLNSGGWSAPDETIVGATAYVDPAGLDIEAVTYDDRTVTMRLAGGLGGNARTTVRVRAETSAGQFKLAEFAVISTGPAASELPVMTVTGGFVFEED